MTKSIVLKMSAVALSVGLLAGCATTDQLKQMQADIDSAKQMASQAQSTADAADSKADAAMQKADAAMRAADQANERADRMMEKCCGK